MKNTGFMIFFSIVLGIYALLNFYIFIRGWQAIPREAGIRQYYVIVFLFVALSFFAGRFLEKVYLSVFSDFLVWVGSFWLAAMLYFFLIILILDMARLVNHFVPFYSSAITSDYSRAKVLTAIISVALVVVAIAAGHINTRFPRVRDLEVTIPKVSPVMKNVKMVVASDIHLGQIVGRVRLNQMVGMINSLSPDIVILAGDIVDEDLGPVIRENLGETLRNIKAAWGVYAITGNHEWYGGVEQATRYLDAHGVQMLRDSVVKINNSFYLVGREDREKYRMTGIHRKTLDTLMAGIDLSLPIIDLDHQPIGLKDAMNHQIDLQISGHTHHGQIWPLNYITDLVYQLSVGFRKFENTYFYVSTGYGTWGPPVRLGNRPEIVNIKLHFQ